MNKSEFQETVWQKGRELYRDMPWRQNTQPYYVLVSEMMLQQTQVDRVIPKFQAFIQKFPTVKALADASLADVLVAWSGLGYNRRAKFLWQAAQKVQNDFGGVLPETLESLMLLPGVGANTAGAILTYSFNQPVAFIETNVRTVYFEHFFADRTEVSDRELKDVVGEYIDHEHPREWAWALMDYGVYLKKQGLGRLDQSKHYKKQAPLKGSLREVRGMILKQLALGALTQTELRAVMPQDDRYDKALEALLSERMIQQSGEQLHLAGDTV